jgi:dihydroorotate dehydrogenase electron transfer subunit
MPIAGFQPSEFEFVSDFVLRNSNFRPRIPQQIMTHHCPTYPDHAWHGTTIVEENVGIAQDTYRIRVRCPEVAEAIVPGQFLMLRLPGVGDPLLGRPLALYDVVLDADGRATSLDIVYLAIGKMTRRLATLARGASLELWGPLGNGFPPQPAEHLVMVAGGIGQTPFLSLAKEYLGLQGYGRQGRHPARAGQLTLLYGVRSAAYLAGVDDFRQLGVGVRVSTDDGSAGHQGLVTDLIRPAVASSKLASRLVCCGPEKMMAAAARIARELELPCQVSLESPMACGVGACFSCVVKVREGDGWDYRRSCIEGPVFDARDVEIE